MTNELPRTFGGYVPKRRNKRKAPLKYQMISFLRDYRNIGYSQDTPLKAIKKAFADNGGLDWWNNKKGESK